MQTNPFSRVESTPFGGEGGRTVFIPSGKRQLMKTSLKIAFAVQYAPIRPHSMIFSLRLPQGRRRARDEDAQCSYSLSSHFRWKAPAHEDFCGNPENYAVARRPTPSF